MRNVLKLPALDLAWSFSAMPFPAKLDDAIKRAVGQHPLESSETGPADSRRPRDGHHRHG